MKWTNEEIEVLNANYSDKNEDDIVKMFNNRTYNSIKLKANSLGIYKSSTFYDDIRKSNMSSLLSNSHEAYYWVGFILADGHIHNEKRITITLSNKDKKHLEKLKFFLDTNIITDDYKCYISIQNNEVCPKVCDKFSINNNKTNKPPNFYDYNFNEEMLFSLIMGFIDGDGCIKKVYKRNDCSLSIRIHRTWLNNLLFIENFLYSYFKIKKQKILTRLSSDGYSTLIISDNEILAAIKKEAIKINLPILNRKWSLIDENYISKYTIKKLKKHEVIKLHENNISAKNISNILGIKIGSVYEYIREYKNK